MSPETLSQTLPRAVADVRALLPRAANPQVGLILGSGLGGFADDLGHRVSVPFHKIAGLPTSTVEGHKGALVYGKGGVGRDVEVLALQGRVHSYEGYSLQEVSFPARVLVAAGCKTLLITNAAGGVDSSMTPGEIVLIRDHINLLGGSPLRGHNDATLGPRFPDMTEAYSPALRQLVHAAASEIGLTLREGVYAALPGPTYETPSEVKMVRVLGGDLVGMSTVPEVHVARHMGAEVIGLSCVTNLAAGISGQKLSHEEVTETANRVRATFIKLLDQILSALLQADRA